MGIWGRNAPFAMTSHVNLFLNLSGQALTKLREQVYNIYYRSWLFYSIKLFSRQESNRLTCNRSIKTMKNKGNSLVFTFNISSRKTINLRNAISPQQGVTLGNYL